VGGGIVGIEAAQGIGDFVGHFFVVIGLEHPVVEATMSAAGRAPAFGGVERKMFGVEFRK